MRYHAMRNRFPLRYQATIRKSQVQFVSWFSTDSSQTPFVDSTNSAFVSKHYVVSTKEIREIVAEMKTEFRKGEGHIEVKHCYLCSKGNRQNADNLWKLYINPNGSFHCFRCSIGGSWFDLKKRVRGEEELCGETDKQLVKSFALPDQDTAYSYTKVLQFYQSSKSMI